MPSSIEVPAEIIPAATAPLEQGKTANDDQLIEIWLHGRSEHTVRAYRADIQRFRVGAGKPLESVGNGS